LAHAGHLEDGHRNQLQDQSHNVDGLRRWQRDVIQVIERVPPRTCKSNDERDRQR
jgi:hypothetical protein